MLIAIPIYISYTEKATIAVLEANQDTLLRTINLMKVSGELPILYEELADKLNESKMYIKNPIDGNTNIIYTGGVNFSNGAAIVISQNKSHPMQRQVNNPSNYIYPFRTGSTVDSPTNRNKLNGTLFIQYCKDGYLFYYQYKGIAGIENIQGVKDNIIQFPFL